MLNIEEPIITAPTALPPDNDSICQFTSGVISNSKMLASLWNWGIICYHHWAASFFKTPNVTVPLQPGVHFGAV
jgi:hypothetical protein